MTRFIISLHASPWSHQSVLTAVQFAQAAIKRGNQVKAIFLYQDAVLNASPSLDISSDELNGQTHLLQLHEQHGVPLMLCVTAAEKRGLVADNIKAGFRLAGLAELAELSTETDKLVQFK